MPLPLSTSVPLPGGELTILDDRDLGEETARAGRFGYASRHLLVRTGDGDERHPEIAGQRASVQVRTVLQHAWAEFEHDIRYKGNVPEDAAHLKVAVRGQVRVVSAQKTGDLADAAEAAVGGIHQTEAVEALHLESSAAGHVLHLLGKTGEPRAGRAVSLTFKHVAVTTEVSTTLETDARGRIELGDTDHHRLTVILTGQLSIRGAGVGDDGRFAFERLDPGVYQLEVQRGGSRLPIDPTTLDLRQGPMPDLAVRILGPAARDR